MRTNKISVIGLGKLGICTAACFALKGFNVLGVDLNEKTVVTINNGVAPTNEPQLGKILRKVVPDNLKATINYDRVMKDTDITFIIVPSPSKTDNTFTDYFVKKVLDRLIDHNKNEKPRHLFVIVSTLMPGGTNKLKRSGPFGFVYNPEFVAIGSIIRDFFNPDMVLIGAAILEDARIIEDIYKKTCDNNPYIAKMSIMEAEIAKLSLNCFITMKISFANLLSDICDKSYSYEQRLGVNVDNITKALGADKRISPYCFKAGMPFGGTCFPRDVRAFEHFLSEKKISPLLPKAIMEINDNVIDLIVHKIWYLFNYSSLGERVIAILGMSFKAGTSIIQESPSVKLASRLIKEGFNVIVYDKHATEYLKGYFNEKVSYASSVAECFRDANIMIIATPEKEFSAINNYTAGEHKTTIIDCWRILERGYKWKKNVGCIRLGDTYDVHVGLGDIYET